MGGYGSGRTGWKGKVENCRSLDVNRLSKEGCLRPGYRGGWEWTADGEQVASIGLRATADQLILNYRVCCNGEDWTECGRSRAARPVAVQVRRHALLFRLPGGEERAAVQPSRDQALSRRSIFSVPPLLRSGVRQSERRPATYRLLRRADKRKIALGGTWGSFIVPPKPKGMHWRTYERYLAEIDAAEEQGVLAFLTGRRRESDPSVKPGDGDHRHEHRLGRKVFRIGRAARDQDPQTKAEDRDHLDKGNHSHCLGRHTNSARKLRELALID